MLQDIREKSKGWIQYLIIGFIALTFLIIGTGSFTLNQNKQVLAKVNSSEITQREVDNYAERLMLQQGDRAKYLDSSVVKLMALNSIIQDKAMMAASTKRGFIVSKDQILNSINSNPVFLQDGVFSVERYRNILSQNYYTDLEYRALVASRYVNNQLQHGLILTNFTLDNDLKTFFKYIDQQRDIEYVVLRHEDFVDKVEVTDEQILNEYTQNKQDYMSPELVKIAYLELSEDSLKKDIQYTDEQIEQYYLEHVQTFTDPDKYKVAHILAEFKPEDEQSQQAAKLKMEEIQAKLSNGQSFAELAKTYSDDPISAKKGGELLWIIKGELGVDLNFDEAVYKLNKPGDRSEVISTKYGYHLIELLEKEDASVSLLKDVKDKVIDMYTTHKAQDLLFDKADDLVSMSYEYSDNLDKAADLLGLELKTSNLFGRKGGEDAITQDAKVIQAAFSEEVLLDKHNSDLLEISKNHFAVIRVIDHQRSSPIPLEQVSAQIKKKLEKIAASELAAKHAEELKAEINTNDLASVKESSKFTWKKSTKLNRSDTGLDAAIVNKSFEIPSSELNKAGVASMMDGDYAIVVLKQVKDGDIDGSDEEDLAQVKTDLSQLKGGLDFQLFAQEARSQVKIDKTAD